MARESRSRDKDKDAKPLAGDAASPSTSLTVTLQNPLGKKRKRSSTSAADQPHVALSPTSPATVTPGDRLLGHGTREAIRILLEAMCPDMPVNSPARDILTLPLPPSYETTLENRLSHHLASPTLTRAQLVDTLSTLASNLLPSNTPSPFRKEPSNLTALDEHTRAVYSLFRSIHRILHALPATTSALATCPSASPSSSLLPIDLLTRQPHIHATAFSLSQKLPGSGTQADWFTSPVTKQQVAVLVKSGSQQQSPNEAEITTDNADDREAMEQDETGLAKATQSGMNWFGHAVAVPIHDTLAPVASTSSRSERTLGDSVYQRASLQVDRIKKLRALSRKRLFGAVTHTVDFTAHTRTSWQPSFGMTHDSTSASGGWGFMSSWDMGYRTGAWSEWDQEHWGENVNENSVRGERGVGVQEEGVVRNSGDEDEATTLLELNQRRLKELSEWQSVRVRRGDRHWVSAREASVAGEVLETLSSLAGGLAPSTLLPSNSSAATLASKVVHVPAPHIRGLLDPKRPRAVVDNDTVRLLPRNANADATSQLPQQRFMPGQSQVPRNPTPHHHYTPASRPHVNSQYHPQQPPRVSTPQQPLPPVGQYNSYSRQAGPYSQTPTQRPGQPYSPQPYGRTIHTTAATPIQPRASAPLVAASMQAYGAQPGR